MITIACLFTRKPGLTMAQFEDYYENHHVPLVQKLLPQPAGYRRSYAVDDREYRAAHGEAEERAGGPAPARPFDVLTEVVFDDEAHYQQMVDALSDPVIGAAVAADESEFLDRPSMRTYFVRERR